jgi:hypothetical protein
MPSGQPTPVTGSPPAYNALQPREAEFCEHYLASYDLGRAGEAMGMPRKRRMEMARRLFAQRHIQQAIEQRKAELMKTSGVYVEQIRDEMRALAFFDVGRLFAEVDEPVLDDKGAPELDLHGKPVRRRVICLKSLSEIDTRAISALDITNTPYGPRIKVRTHPKKESLEVIGRDAGAFQDDTKPLPIVHMHMHFSRKAAPQPKVTNPNGERQHGPGA